MLKKDQQSSRPVKPVEKCARLGCHNRKVPGAAFCVDCLADPDNHKFTCDSLPPAPLPN